MKLKVALLGTLLLLSGCQTLQSPESSADMMEPTEPVETQTAIHARSALDRSGLSQDHANLWSRATSQMQLAIPQNAEIKKYRDWYIKHPRHIQTIAKRASPFLYLIVEEIEQRQMPMELVLLPVVESAYNPNARSHGNAVGLWQFIDSTGNRFGLKQDYWYDGRKDVLASTDAALDYLSELNKLFDGDWLNAIAAYNAGEGRIQKAIATSLKAGGEGDFWSLQLPRETTAYVPRLLALADVVKNADHYGITLPDTPNRPRLQVIETQGQMNLSLAAKLANMSLPDLKRLNPGYHRNMTSPQGPNQLLVPFQNADELELALADMSPSKGARWDAYKIRRGDSMGLIAKRHGIALSALSKANPSTNPARLKPGQILMIPNQQAQQLQDELDALTRISKTRQAAAPHRHKVRAGENLKSISLAYQVSERELRRWNNLTGKAALKPGQSLLIRAPATAGTVSYKVKRGDSINSIAQKFQISVSDLLRWNQLERRNILRPGQTLTLKLDSNGA